MRLSLVVSVSILALCVAACGGDGAQPGAPTGQVPTPPAPPPPPPSPPPPPTSPADPTLLTLSSTTQLTGFQGDSGYTRDAAGNITSATNVAFGPGTVATINAAGGISYLASGFHLFGMPAFDSINLTADAARSTATFAVSAGASNGVSMVVNQLRVGPSNPSLPLVYTSIAYARSTYRNPSTGETLNGIVPFSFGLQYDWQAYRPTGTAAYDGLIVGHARATGASNAYDISGRIHYDINFDTTDASGYIELTGQNDVSGESVSFGRIEIVKSRRGSLDAVISSIDTPNGRIQTFFTGGQAQEMMGAIDGSLVDPKVAGQRLKVTGAFAAKR